MVDSVSGSDGSGSVDSTSLSDALANEQNSAARAREQEIRNELAANPQAIAALDRLSQNLNCYNLTDAQKVEALNDFMAAPNLATAAYVEGQVAQELGVNAAAAHSLLSPDAGTLTIGGQTYSIDHGALVDAQGRRAGTINNYGEVQLNGEQQARSVYSDLNARVQLRMRQLAVRLRLATEKAQRCRTNVRTIQIRADAAPEIIHALLREARISTRGAGRHASRQRSQYIVKRFGMGVGRRMRVRRHNKFSVFHKIEVWRLWLVR